MYLHLSCIHVRRARSTKQETLYQTVHTLFVEQNALTMLHDARTLPHMYGKFRHASRQIDRTAGRPADRPTDRQTCDGKLMEGKACGVAGASCSNVSSICQDGLPTTPYPYPKAMPVLRHPSYCAAMRRFQTRDTPCLSNSLCIIRHERNRKQMT